MPIDYRDYPVNWKEISLRIRKERAGDKCETCGRANGSVWVSKDGGRTWEEDEDCQDKVIAQSMRNSFGWKVTRIVLTVAHIGAPFADGSPGDKHDKHDVREENLKALCQRCHLKLDQNDHQTNRRNGRNWRKGQQRLEIP